MWRNHAVSEHFSECEHAQYLASLQNQFTLLNDLPLPSDIKYNNLLNTTNPSSTLVLRPVKNYNFSRNYSNVVLLVGSFFVT